MRVVGGTAKGTRLLAVPGDSTRPVLDRVKTALFDVLRGDLPDIRMLDLFAGTGSIGIEALSQGAASCLFLDLNARSVETIRTNLNRCRLESGARVLRTDAFSFLKRTGEEFDLVYVAPPQYEGMWEQALYMLAERPELLSSTGQIVVQIDPREYAPLSLSEFNEAKQKRYGNTLLIFYRKAAPAEQ